MMHAGHPVDQTPYGLHCRIRPGLAAWMLEFGTRLCLLPSAMIAASFLGGGRGIEKRPIGASVFHQIAAHGRRTRPDPQVNLPHGRGDYPLSAYCQTSGATSGCEIWKRFHCKGLRFHCQFTDKTKIFSSF
jgi:hypothetical protein